MNRHSSAFPVAHFAMPSAADRVRRRGGDGHSAFYADTDIIYDSSLEGRWILYGDNHPMGYDDNESWDPPIKLIFEKPYSPPTTTTASEPKQKEYKLTVQTLG